MPERPHDFEAERHVLGVAIYSPEMRPSLIERVTEGHFDTPRHRLIWKVITNLYPKDIDVHIVAHELELRGEPRTWPDGLTIYDYQPISDCHTDYYIQLLEERKFERDLIDMGRRAMQLGSDATLNIEEKRIQFGRLIEGLTSTRSGGAKPIIEVVKQVVEDAIAGVRPERIPTPWWNLNQKLLGGPRRGALVVVGAEPGGGKTVFWENLLRHATKKAGPVLAISAEMDSVSVAQRHIAAEAGVLATHFDAGSLAKGAEGQRRVQLVREAMKRLEQYHPFYIDDTPRISPIEIIAKAQGIKHRHGSIAGIGVDYLQLIAPAGENYRISVGEIARQCKMIAREMDCPVYLLSQLSREGRRPGVRPTMGHLAEAGAIEAHSDVVILLWRDPQKQTDPKVDLHTAIVEKHRGGPTGDVDLWFDKARNRFICLEESA